VEYKLDDHDLFKQYVEPLLSGKLTRREVKRLIRAEQKVRVEAFLKDTKLTRLACILNILSEEKYSMTFYFDGNDTSLTTDDIKKTIEYIELIDSKY